MKISSQVNNWRFLIHIDMDEEVRRKVNSAVLSGLVDGVYWEVRLAGVGQK